MKLVTWNSKADASTSAFAGSAPYLPGSAAQAYRAVRNELKKRFGNIPDIEFVMHEPDVEAGEVCGGIAVVLPEDRGVVNVAVEWKSKSAFEEDYKRWLGANK